MNSFSVSNESLSWGQHGLNLSLNDVQNEEGISFDKKEILENPLSNLIDEMVIFIFCELNLLEWRNFSLTGKRFNSLSQNPLVIASLVEKGFLPCLPFVKGIVSSDERLELVKKQLDLVKKASSHITKMLLDPFFSSEELEQLLKACPNVRELDLAVCDNFTDKLIPLLPKGLISLDLSSCDELTNEGISKLPKSLTSLNLAECKDLTDESISKLPKGLISLDLSWCEKLTDRAISLLPRNLTALNLAECKDLTDEGISKLPKGLISLDLSCCKNLTDRAISLLPRNLTALELAGCEKLTDEAISSFPLGLTALNIRECKKLTPSAVDKFPPMLTSINVWNCSSDFIGAVKSHLSHIKIIN